MTVSKLSARLLRVGVLIFVDVIVEDISA
jgi:hypothetical protein